MNTLAWLALLIAGFYGCLVTIALSYYAGERAHARRERDAQGVRNVGQPQGHRSSTR